MNRKLLPRPAFWAEAAKQKRNKRGGLTLEILIFILVFMVANTVQSFLLSFPEAFWLLREKTPEMSSIFENGLNINAIMELLSEMPPWLVIFMLFSFAGMGAVAILYCRVIEKRKPATMGLSKQHAVREYLIGLLVGAVMFGAVAGLSIAFRGYTLRPAALTSKKMILLVIAFIGFLIQGAAEELLVRGYLATSLGTKAPVVLAVVESALMFAFLHVANVGVNFLAFINLTLCGIFFCSFMIKRNNIWGACAAHSMWNFMQGCIFGFPVSGMPNLPSVLESEKIGFNDLLTGGEFGPEGSLCTTIVILAAIIIVLTLKPKAVAVPEPPAQENDPA